MESLIHVHLLTGWLPASLFGITASLLLVTLIVKPRISRQRAALLEFVSALCAGSVGYVLIWLMSDKWMLFGVEVGWLVKFVVTSAAAVLGLTIMLIVDSAAFRRTLACILVPFIILSAALGINMIYGEYGTLGTIFGIPNYRPLETKKSKSAAMTITQWKELARADRLPSMPAQGEIRTVSIPATVSKFVARDADVYLPPAALSRNPPALPVMVMLAGQPGSPDRFFEASDITVMLNDYAKRHHGLAPIVISPDQNGSTKQNSLCADTHVYGKAETYLTVDVTRWVIDNLPVSESPDHWLIGGFSQGGTCSTQLGPAHPDLYGHIFSADGELEPTSHNRTETINRYFNGDAAAYMKHIPTEIIARMSPSTQTLFSTAGAWDKESQRNQEIIGRAALKAGMGVTTLISKRSGHDWHAVQAALKPEIAIFGTQSGLGNNTVPLDAYPNIQIVDLLSTTTTEVK